MCGLPPVRQAVRPRTPSLTERTRKASIDHDKCVGCGRCLGACNFDAIVNRNSCANDELNAKVAQYAKAVVAGRPHFHISLVVDVSPYCDCHAENDLPILPDVGMFASFDRWPWIRPVPMPA